MGCEADGKNVQCRFCGAGDYAEVLCPPSSCHFPNEPFVPYFWDSSCKMGQLGCWADGVHEQCRFCGDHPYTNVTCADVVGGQRGHPDARPAKDDGLKECTFVNEPFVPYYWDHECSAGKLGCLADGVHEQCRFCEQRPFEDVPCPASVAPPKNRCTFGGSERATLNLYFWDENCTMGDLGCWADGLHRQCRFCGSGPYHDVPCPTARMTGAADSEGAAQPIGDNSYTSAKSQEKPAMDIQAATGGDDEVLMSGVDAKHSSVCWLVGFAASLLCIRSSQETERH